MSTLFEIAYNILLPIFLIIGIAIAVDRLSRPDPRTLARFSIFLFTPFLAFEGMANNTLTGGEAISLAAVAVLMCCGVALVAYIIARTAGFDRRRESAFVLAATVINAGNYGVPLNEFAFGQDGLDRAVLFFIVGAMVTFTLGVFLASRGSVSTREALGNVFRVPLVYAALLGLAVNVFDITLDAPFERTIHLLAQGAIPTMIAVLGIQLSRTRINVRLIGPALLAASMRLVVGPVIALGLVMLFGMSGVTRDVSLVQSAMPTAVIGGVLATEFDADAQFVTTTIFVGTVMSMFTLSVLLSWLL